MEKVIISAAITGGMTVPGQSPAIPITPEEIIESAVGAHEACAVIVHPTTGGGKGMTLEERAAVLPELRPEMATFNTGSFNFGLFPIAERGGDYEEWEVDYLEGTRDYVFRNT